MAGKFEGKVALVTGASSGIGRATALAFAKEGAKVVAASRGAAENDKTVEMIRAMGREAIGLQVDVSRADAVASLFKAITDSYGRLDCAFNGAAVKGPPKPFLERSESEWDQVTGTNLKGVWLCMQHEIRQMLRQGGGCIVNISSMGGFAGARGMAAYAASRHGIVGLTKSAALEFAPSNIRINAVYPVVMRDRDTVEIMSREGAETLTFIESGTSMRLGDPEEVAEGVVWLCSEAASFITGHVLPIEGGSIMW